MVYMVPAFQPSGSLKTTSRPEFLSKERLIEAKEAVRSAEHNGRLRKYYRITEAGLSRIQAFKEEWREIMSIYSFVTKGDTEAHE